MPFKVNALDHLVLNVADAEHSARWYERVLGMAIHRGHRDGGATPRIAVYFGIQKINLRPIGASKDEWFTADHARAGSDDLCFLTDAKPAEIVAHLESCGIAVEVGPVQREGARGPMTSVYCRDPDGNLVEIASY